MHKPSGGLVREAAATLLDHSFQIQILFLLKKRVRETVSSLISRRKGEMQIELKSMVTFR